jgi:hydroxymethylglutaryl-CoA lyase
MKLPPSVTVTEVGPRDGLQSHPTHVDTGAKIRMISRLVEAGFQDIEATSFAHPRMVPQLADAEDVMAALPRPAGVRYRGLVPNHTGAKRAVDAGADVLVTLISAAETYSQKNQGMSVPEALDQVGQIAQTAREANLPWTLIIAMAFFSPYDGPTPAQDVLDIVNRAVPASPEQITLGTTSGVTGPGQVASLCATMRREWPTLPVGVHLHNANGMALACALAALDAGAETIESSICGIGGGVLGAATGGDTGNVPTEDLVAMLDDLGITTGLNSDEVVRTAREINDLLGLGHTGFSARTGTRAEILAAHHT